MLFCGEVCIVDKKHPNHSKGWHKVGVLLSHQTPILNKCHERAEKCADHVLRWLSSSIDLVASDAIYHQQCESIFLRKNVYLRQRVPKLNARLDTPRLTHWNQILKNYANNLMNKQNCLQSVGFMQNCVHLQKWSKCLLFKMDEKAVRLTLPKFNFF